MPQRLNAPELTFTVTREGECPMYRVGDVFLVGGMALNMPHDRPVCLILLGDITRRLNAGTPADGEEITCAGCGGRVRLSCRTASAPAGEAPSPSLDRKSFVELLRRLPLFHELGDEDLVRISPLARIRKCEPGDVLIDVGEAGQYLYIVIRGRMAVTTRENVRIADLGPGEVFGEMSLFSGEVCHERVTATEPGVVMVLDGRHFRRFYNLHRPLRIYFTRLMALRLARNNQARVEEFSLGIVGRLSEMPPSEIFQTLHDNQKTGVLHLDIPSGGATVAFRDGEIVHARFGELQGVDAFYEALKATEGAFRFRMGPLREEDRNLSPLGDFMALMMEGARRIDEEA